MERIAPSSKMMVAVPNERPAPARGPETGNRPATLDRAIGRRDPVSSLYGSMNQTLQHHRSVETCQDARTEADPGK